MEKDDSDPNIRSKHPVSMAKPPDGGWGWVIVVSSFLVHIFTDGITYSFGVFYTEFLAVFKESQSTTSWINSLLGGVILCSGPLASIFVDRWGCRMVTVSGTLLAAGCIIISAFANCVAMLIVVVGFGVAIGFGMIYLPAIISVTVWFEKKRSFATGIAVCGSGFGTFLFAPIIAALISYYGWQGALLILGAIVLNCAPLGLLFLPVPRPENETKIKKTTDAEPGRSKPSSSKPIKQSYQSELTTRQKLCRDLCDPDLLKDSIFIIFLVSNFLTSVGFFIPYVYTKPHGELMGVTNAEYLISTMGAANVVGRLILGYVCDKPGVNRLMAYTWCLIICGISVGAAAVCTGFWTLAGHSAVFGFTIGAYVGLTSVVTVDLLGLEKLTHAFGLLLLAAGIASIMGPPIAGWMFDSWGSYTPVFLGAGICITLSGVILLPIPIIRRMRKRAQRKKKEEIERSSLLLTS